LNPTGIIFTKIDETTRPGKVVSAMREVDLPVSYISYGQSIPTDIRDDVGEFIWEKILELI
jgi:flagellar biosynthesis protein FlhF